MVEIPATEVERKLAVGEQPLIVDIREPFEWHLTGVVPGARLSPMKTFLLEELNGLGKDREVILICASGVRTLEAVKFMQARGYTGAVSMAGGMKAWQGVRVKPTSV